MLETKQQLKEYFLAKENLVIALKGIEEALAAQGKRWNRVIEGVIYDRETITGPKVKPEVFTPGDFVRVSNNCPLSFIAGNFGKVLAVRTYCISVEFPFRDVRLHDCNGLTRPNHGYDVYDIENLEYVD